MKCIRVKSKQENVEFVYSPNPITIDKSKSWGEGSIQNFPNGAYLKLNDGVVSHGVQPNDDNTAPVGWYKNKNGSYNKKDIFVVSLLPFKSDDIKTVEISTLDGVMNYDIKKPSVIVAQNVNGTPDLKDIWTMTLDDLNKFYHFNTTNMLVLNQLIGYNTTLYKQLN